MNGTSRLSGPAALPASGGVAKQLVVLLHGIGADGRDLIGLARPWSEWLPDALFVSPNAPFPCETAGFGYQWFGIRTLTMEELAAGVRAAAPVLDRFLDEELARLGLADDRLALVGFSQGTMMSLHVGLRRRKPCAGILGYSGLLVEDDTLEREILSRPPVFLVHGTMDELIPFPFMRRAAAVLGALDVPVETEARPGLGHGIDEVGVTKGALFLRRMLAEASA